MNNQQCRHVTVKPVIYPHLPVSAYGPGNTDGERVLGADGKLIVVGQTVRNPERRSAHLGATVPTSYGKVAELYRVTEDGRVLVACENGHVYYADRCRFSTAGEADEVEHQRLLDMNTRATTRKRVRREGK